MKHLLHCLFSELANRTWHKFIYLDDEYLLFLDVSTPELRIIIILPTDWPEVVFPTARTTNNQVASA